MQKRYKILLLITLFIIFFIPVIFFMKSPVINHLAKSNLVKLSGAKWEKLFLARGNDPWLEFDEEKSEFKKNVLKYLTFDVPKNPVERRFKAKIVCGDGSIIYLWFSPNSAWCFSNSNQESGKLYRVKHLPYNYSLRLSRITFFRKLLDTPPKLPCRISKNARKNLELLFKDINPSSSINMKRLAGYFQKLHDCNILTISPYKSVVFAKKNSEYLLKHKGEITYKDFLINTGAIDE
jgi:hypothetical protein